MVENANNLMFKLNKMNALALLKVMCDQQIITYKVHFDLWQKVLYAKKTKELEAGIAEIERIFEEKKKESPN